MQMTKKSFDLTVQMREDLMTVYRDVSPRCWSQSEAWRRTVEHRAPRYYVSAKQAHDKLRRMVVGDMSEVDGMSAPRRRMYYSLFAKLQEMTQRKEFVGKSLWFLCPFLVTQEAPEFFISPNTLEQIYSNYKRHGKDYRHLDVYGKKRRGKKGCADSDKHTDASII